ncbi:MAG: hypothetical protein V7765_17765 [Oleispira sp.]
MNKIIDQIREISETKESAMSCGGTYSANNLRICLSLLQELESYKDHSEYEKVLDAVLVTKDNLQSALINHNSNELKFIEYNLETGLPIKPENNKTFVRTLSRPTTWR